MTLSDGVNKRVKANSPGFLFDYHTCFQNYLCLIGSQVRKINIYVHMYFVFLLFFFCLLNTKKGLPFPPGAKGKGP